MMRIQLSTIRFATNGSYVLSSKTSKAKPARAMAQNMRKMFPRSCSLKKTSDQRDLRLRSVYFQFLSDEIDHQFCQIAKWKNSFFWCNCKFYHFKIEKLTLSNLSFLWSEVFLREQEEIFSTYFGPLWLIRVSSSFNFTIMFLSQQSSCFIDYWTSNPKFFSSIFFPST